MSDTIITVENLSKRYKLGVIGATSLRESAERAWHRLRGRDWREEMGTIGRAAMPRPIETEDGRLKTEDLGRETEDGRLSCNGCGARPHRGLKKSSVFSLQSDPNDLWALKDVSFEVKRGEVLGVIGRNGAGKSTLLKILTRITEPTSGRAVMRGRVASLLEVGTGFHPELTGRENVYLNGAILGMKRAEITRKFDEIVAFAEVEQFIDTPVKRYSSGMYVRLAFAVAAHLEPEILLVDEVLAVGDAAFQKRCLGKMGEVAREGRTVLFVSHNMSAVAAVCKTAIQINNGRIVTQGSVGWVINDYLEEGRRNDENTCVVSSNQTNINRTMIINASVCNADTTGPVFCESRLRISVNYEGSSLIQLPKFFAGIYDKDDIGICVFSSEAAGWQGQSLPPSGLLECVTDPINITPGRYYLNSVIFSGDKTLDHARRLCWFEVLGSDFYGTGLTTLPHQGWMRCLVKHKWEAKLL